MYCRRATSKGNESNKKLRDFLVIAFLVLFVATQKLVFLWLIAAALIVFHARQANGRMVHLSLYREDAERHGLIIPKNRDIHDLLEKVYERYQRAKLLQPKLASQYDDLIDELWEGLKFETTDNGWVTLLRKVIVEWPELKKEVHQNLQQKLRKVREMSDQWNQAAKEARGESPS